MEVGDRVGHSDRAGEDRAIMNGVSGGATPRGMGVAALVGTGVAVLVTLSTAGSISPLVPSPADPDTIALDPGSYELLVDETTLAIVTFRAGLAGRLAHDHLVHAGDFDASLTFDPDEPADAAFSGTLQVRDLVVDEPDRMARVQPILQEFDLLPREFGDVGDSGRADVREEMLDEGQLHAESYPEIAFRSVEVTPAEDDEEFPWRVQAALTVQERERATEMRARWFEEEGRIRIQAGGEFHFTDFEIEPYRAFLGSVQNQDRFVLFLDLVAEPTR
jgi:polyisoprenoid-binding protein YceI